MGSELEAVVTVEKITSAKKKLVDKIVRNIATFLIVKPLLCYNLLMSPVTQNRTKTGRFIPGQSGNPGGRPKDEHRVAELARSYTLEAINTLVELMRDGKDERLRGTAAQALLDRGWGKAKVEVVTDTECSYLDVLRVVNERINNPPIKRQLHTR